MFLAGLAVSLALVRPRGRVIPHRLLLVLMWIGCAVLVLVAVFGLLDGLLRGTGPAERGLTGLTDTDTVASRTPRPTPCGRMARAIVKI